jgi:hypothetical protein
MPVTVNHARLVARKINDLTTHRFDVDHFALADNAHVLVAAQVSSLVGLSSQPLNTAKHLLFLKEECITQALCPVQVSVHPVQEFGKRDERHHRGIPGPTDDRIYRNFAPQIRILTRPAGRLDHLQRISGCNQHMGQNGVGIKRNGRQKLIQFRLTKAMEIARNPSSDQRCDHHAQERGGRNCADKSDHDQLLDRC